MPDEKISDLPPTASVNLDDTFEKSRHNAAPSERMTAQQLVTFMQTAMALLQLSGGNIKFNADGSGSLGKQNFADGTLSLLDALTGSNMIVLSGNDGSGNFSQGQISLNGDGSARFASGVTTIAADGSGSFDNANIQLLAGGSIVIGSAVANGVLDILNVGLGATIIHLDGGTGAATFGVSGFDANSSLSIGGGPSATISALDGSASFSNGQATIDASGNLGIVGTQVVTAQQPAIADATNAVDVITQFNTLLAELRTHGLIAT